MCTPFLLQTLLFTNDVAAAKTLALLLLEDRWTSAFSAFCKHLMIFLHLNALFSGNNKKGKSLAREVLTGLLLTEENRFVLSQNAKYSNVMKLKKDLKQVDLISPLCFLA